ncbi:hypothetical protein QMK28_21320 [Streptomyces sp. H27-D2]|nr:hypothetical protein [Streptomyces sp. H27-D2]MEC4018770.1 hypothetical protein [Streptomyces sp. H27-D2]
MCRAAGVVLDTIGRQEIYRYEKGIRTPREWLPFIAAALGVPVAELELAAAAKAAETAPATVADFLPEGDPLAPLAVRQGRRIGVGAVADLQRRIHALRLADDVIAGGDLLRPALRELRSAVRVYRESSHTEAIGRTLLQAIGELAQIVGWIASDAGRHDEADRIYRLGLSAAHTAADATLAGNILGSLAYQRTNTGDVSEGLAMACAALENTNGEAPPRARALYLDRAAWPGGHTVRAQRALAGRPPATGPRNRRRRPLPVGHPLVLHPHRPRRRLVGTLPRRRRPGHRPTTGTNCPLAAGGSLGRAAASGVGAGAGAAGRSGAGPGERPGAGPGGGAGAGPGGGAGTRPGGRAGGGAGPATRGTPRPRAGPTERAGQPQRPGLCAGHETIRAKE